MEYKITDRGIEIKLSDRFDLKNTFDCGQCFRWTENPDGSYSGIVRGKYARVVSDGGVIIIEGSSEDDFLNIWKGYFDLENDYNEIRREISELCPKLVCALDSMDGIRILSQEPWEALCSFIISQNNNIPRIKGIVTRLCENFGERGEYGYSFPTADRIAQCTEEELSPLRSGFRAAYIADAARRVSCGEVVLENMYTLPIDECRAQLMKIKGVGPKVAECTLLYGLHRLDAFPIDVWMKRALSTLFSGISVSDLGRYAGVAQQYIFHYSRLESEKLKTENESSVLQHMP